MQNSIKKAAVITAILWSNILLISFLFETAIAYNYENDVPPLVNPSVYSTNSEELYEEHDSEPESFVPDLEEHLEVPTMDTSVMTEEELQFHYFKMQDSDEDNHLDGCELIKMIIHRNGSLDEDYEREKFYYDMQAKLTGKEHPHHQVENKSWTDADLANLIDPVLQRFDVNGDGFIDYTEYKSSFHG